MPVFKALLPHVDSKMSDPANCFIPIACLSCDLTSLKIFRQIKCANESDYHC